MLIYSHCIADIDSILARDNNLCAVCLICVGLLSLCTLKYTDSVPAIDNISEVYLTTPLYCITTVHLTLFKEFLQTLPRFSTGYGKNYYF